MRRGNSLMSKFIITRKDLDLDPVVIESEGLTLGSLSGNDLALDHSAVSGVHAAIEGADGDFWIFNLSEESGTLLNGEQVGQGPLAEGDVIQIGPFFLAARCAGGDLRLEVERSSRPLVIDAPAVTQAQAPEEKGITIRFDPTWLALSGRLDRLQRDEPPPAPSRRSPGAGRLSDRLTGIHAL